MLQNTHPLKLQLLSLNFSEPLAEDIGFIISLSKGFQTYGQLKFYAEASVEKVRFEENNCLNFFYTPRVLTRRDVLFKICLTDCEENQQVGQISLSTNQLAEIFGKNKREVIDKTTQFQEGISLTYKIYMPIEVVTEPKISFKKQEYETDDILKTIFSMNAPPKKPIRKRPPPVLIPEEKDVKKKVQKMGMGFFRMLTGQKPSQSKPQTNDINDDRMNDFDDQNKSEEDPQNPQIKIHFTKKQQQIPQQKLFSAPSNESQRSPILLNIMMNNVKKDDDMRSSFSMENSVIYFKEQAKKRQKYRLMSQITHHQSYQLSIKLKTVIAMVIFGIIFIYIDFIGDQHELKNISRSRAKSHRHRK